VDQSKSSLVLVFNFLFHLYIFFDGWDAGCWLGHRMFFVRYRFIKEVSSGTLIYLPQATICCVYCCFVVSLTSMAEGAQGPAAGGLLQPTVLAKQALQIGAGKG
jgi:hypothetical protein